MLPSFRLAQLDAASDDMRRVLRTVSLVDTRQSLARDGILKPDFGDLLVLVRG